MSVQRFSGSNSREAMRKVKAVLGKNALIISNRSTDFGIEIMAAPETDYFEGDNPDTCDSVVCSPEQADGEPPLPADEPSQCTEASLKGNVTSRPAPATEIDREGPRAEGGSSFNDRLMAEVRDVKKLVASSAARLQESTSNDGRLHSLLLEAGFSEELAVELVMELPEDLRHSPWDGDVLKGWLQRRLALRLPAPLPGETLVDAGGIFVLVGPTGSGKTTTTAKIAAQYVMRHGAESLALVSADYYRIGAHEQLREYARILGVTFRAVEEGRSLANVLDELDHTKVILVDTVGLSQRDERVLDQFTELGAASNSLTYFLLLSGSSHQHTLEEVVKSYRHSARNAGASIDHCILTKLDEAYSPALLLDKVICHSLRAVFTTSGQRVPEDIDPPELLALLNPLLDQVVRDDGVSRVPAPAPQRSLDWTRHLLSQGRQLSMTMRLLREAVPGVHRLERLWEISLLHPTWQPARVAELQQESLTSQLAHPHLLWSEPKSQDGTEWPCPHLALDDTLTPTAISLLQCSVDEPLSGLVDADSDWEAHLFAVLPDVATLRALSDRNLRWSAPITRRNLVTVAGETKGAACVESDGHEAGAYAVNFRTREARLQLRRLPCTFEATAVDAPEPLEAEVWSGVTRCESSGAVLRRRLWLTSREQGIDVLLRAQSLTDGYAALTRHAMRKLEDMPGFQSCPDLRLLVAGALAGIALRVEGSPTARCAELRDQLMAVLGGKRACTTQALVDALSYLFIAQELLVPARTN